MTDLSILSDKLSYIMNLCSKITDNASVQKFHSVDSQMQILTKRLDDFFTCASSIFEPEVFSSVLTYIDELTDAYRQKDYILLGDFIQLNLLPAFCEIQSILLENIDYEKLDYFEENMKNLESSQICTPDLIAKLHEWYRTYRDHLPNGYHIEPTNSGFPTLRRDISDKSQYFHSNANPFAEAVTFANAHLKPGRFQYTLFGLGLGYQAPSLLNADRRIQLTVIEPDLHVIGLMLKYRRAPFLLSCKRLTLVYLPELQGLSDYLTADCEFIIHYPTLATLPDSRQKHSLQQYFLQYSTIHEQERYLDENFYYNQKRGDAAVDVLKEAFTGKTVLYLGGGPSSESKLPDIQRYLLAHPDTISVCAGKIYRALLSSGFTPDYVILSDPNVGLSWQTRDIPATKASLLYLSTASSEAVDCFQGNRYIFYQTGYQPAEVYAEEHHNLTVSTGGSVSTCAIDLFLQLGCSKLITTGLDLSYPDRQTHAFGIQGKTAQNLSYEMTTDLYGKPIQTSKVFLTYLRWIENRLKNVSSVALINLTDGAKINGMQNVAHL